MMENGDGGAKTETSGADSAGEKQDTKTVAFADHERALKDMHRFKREKNELSTKIGDLEAQMNTMKENDLRKQEDFKTLSERKAEEAQSWEGKYKSLQTSFDTTQKYNAVQSKAVHAGLIDGAIEDLGRLDLEDVSIEKTDAGRYMVNGVEDFVKSLKVKKPHWFKDDSVPTFNSGGTQNKVETEEVLTPQNLVLLERKYKGDQVKIRELYDKYRKQKASG